MRLSLWDLIFVLRKNKELIRWCRKAIYISFSFAIKDAILFFLKKTGKQDSNGIRKIFGIRVNETRTKKKHYVSFRERNGATILCSRCLVINVEIIFTN